MAKKPTIPTFTGSVSTTQLNTAFTNIKTAFDNTISIDGSTPNAMNADLDLNENDLLNAKDINFSGGLYKDGVDLAAYLGATSPVYFNQADYMHPADLELIRAGTVAGQDATRVTTGMRLMHDEALAKLITSFATPVVVVYEAGVSAINRRLMTDWFNQTLWDLRSGRNCRIIFTDNGPVRWQLSGWLDGHSAVRTDGIYSEILPAHPVPQAVWEWRQGAPYPLLKDFAARVTIVGAENANIDPIGFRTYQVNGLHATGQMNCMSLRNIPHHHEAGNNTTFNCITSRQGCGWQPMEHGQSGLIDSTYRYTVTGSTVTIVNPTTLASVPCFTAAHVGKKIALNRQGIAQRSPDPGEDADIRGPAWFTITSVTGNTAEVTPTPTYATGVDAQASVNNSTFTFAAVMASTTAGSAVVTLSAPVADSLVGKIVSVVGAGYGVTGVAQSRIDELGQNLTAVVTAHTGASITLSVPAKLTVTNQPFIVSPQVYFGPEGANSAGLLHTTWNRNDDMHIRRLWCEANQHGVVQAHFQATTGSSISDDSKLHGTPPMRHNSWGGNYACFIGSHLTMRMDALVTHGMHSPVFGKIILAGKKCGLDLSGEFASWTTPTHSARYYLAPEAADKVAFYVQENIADNTLYFPEPTASQVMVRGTGSYDPQVLYVRSIGSARTPMGDEHPAWPPSEFGPTQATAYGSTRTAAVDAIASGLWTPTDGVTYDIEGISYLGAVGDTSISDLPGLIIKPANVWGSDVAISTDTTVTELDGGKRFTVTANLNLTLPTSPQPNFYFSVSCNSTSIVTLVPGAASVDRGNFVFGGEWATFSWNGSTWRRIFHRGFGLNNAGAMGWLSDLRSTTHPGGLWLVDSTTANIGLRPSCLDSTAVVRIERRDANSLVMTMWSLNHEQGSWRATCNAGTWSAWSNAGTNASLTTAQRPTNVGRGSIMFDTTLGVMIYYNGTVWAAI